MQDRWESESSYAGTDADLLRGRTAGFRAFLLSDIRGYSSFAAARGDEAAAALTERFIAIAEAVIRNFGGENIGNRGDEVLFAFESPRQAIRAAVAFEQALLEATREDPSLPMPAGTGIDVGEAVVVPDGWRANAINLAARLCSIAKGGEILATREVAHLAQAIDGVRYSPRPATRLKGIAEPVNAVRVVADSGDTARGFAELGFTHAEAPIARRRRSSRVLVGVGAAALIVVVAALAAILLGGGSQRGSLGGDAVGAIDTASGAVGPELKLNAPPTSIAVGHDGSLWVASPAAGSLSRIDPKSHAVTHIPVGNDPVAVTVAPDGSVWVANSRDGTVSRVSPQNDAVVATVSVGAGPSALVATADAVWVANTLNGSVTKIDIATGRVARTITVGSEPSGIAAGGGSVWVADQGDANVYRLDEGTGAPVVAPISVGSGPLNMAYGDGAAWVVNGTDGTLSRIDAQSNSVSTVPVGRGPFDVAVGPGGVWVSNEYGNTVAKVDLARLTVTQSMKTDSAPLGLALVGNRLWVATDGIGAAAHRGGVLEAIASGTAFGGQPDPPAIDPGSAFTPDLWRVLVMTSDGLVGYRKEGGVAGNALVPDLAVSLPAATDNGLTYTFRIRSGIRYSNGTLMRASDFARGLERSFKVGGGPIQYFSTLVGAQQCLQRPASCNLSRGVVANDAASTVTFHLTAPDPELFNQLTLPAAYPVPAGTPVHLRGRSIPGTGPYEISAYSPVTSNNPRVHGRLVLRRNPYFRQWSAAAQPAGFPDQIAVRTNYPPAAQASAVEQGRADLAWDAPPQAAIAALGQTFPSQLHQHAIAETTFIWLNARAAPFDNPLARQALSYGVDRGAVGRSPRDSFDLGAPTCQLLPPDFPGYVPYCPFTLDPAPSGRWLAPDISKAQALVRQSGTLGARVTLVAPSQLGRRYGQELVDTLRVIGYRASLHEVPLSQYYSPHSARLYRQFQAGVGNWAADYVASSNFFALLLRCSEIAPGLNAGGVCDRRLDAKISKALSDEAIRPGIASQEWTAIDRMVVDQALVVPVSNQRGSDFVARRVGNYQYNPQWGLLVDQLWVR